MKHIMKCTICGKYTMRDECCNTKCISPAPPKYSPDDQYAYYRRKAKSELLKEKGLI